MYKINQEAVNVIVQMLSQATHTAFTFGQVNETIVRLLKLEKLEEAPEAKPAPNRRTRRAAAKETPAKKKNAQA